MNEGSIYTLGMAVGAGFLIGVGVTKAVTEFIPQQDTVQSGSVVPSQLEIEVDDLDRNGEEEAILIYKGISYLFREDEQGRPYATPYQITVQPITPTPSSEE